MDFSAFDRPQPDVTAFQAEEMCRSVYGVEGTALPLPGERDRTFLLESEAERYVLKVENLGAHPEVLGSQAAAIDWALQADPSLPLARVVPTSAGSPIGEHSGYRLQLSEHVDGVLPREGLTTPGFRRNLGKVAAQLDTALAGFDAPVLRREFPWNLTQLARLRLLLDLHEDHRDLIEQELNHFETETEHALGLLPFQAIHGDLNSDNLVVDRVDPEWIAGIFDFGDVCAAPAVVDLAIAATYQCEHADPVDVLVQMAAAYHLVRPLTHLELSLLPDLVAARCVQSLLMSARQLEANPANAEYVTSDVTTMAVTLGQLTEAKRNEAVVALVNACSLDLPRTSTSEALVARRTHLASSYRLTYSDPVHAMSAEGVWITDAQGRRLLDAYNNVPQVGHGHPQVLAALNAQSRRLNTNTRYLTSEVGEYAERLAALFPDPLSVVFFTNSGSEANDLAYRLATVYSGAKTAVTSSNAYHGATTVTAGLSPEEHGPSVFGDWSTSMDLLNVFAGPTRDVPEPSGQTIAMLIVDTIFSTEGIHLASSDLLLALRDWVRSQGGLLVADEVQAGFGRVGSQFWGFGDVTPDIVTLGKPMGNGYPMGAVVTTREIADRFSASSSYFSTFAGSPVAAAVGHAVLDVVEGESLANHADDVGEYLRRSIVDLGAELIADVRGAGLFVGVEMESDKAAIAIVDEMRQRGVLIGRTGPEGNVLKIRPPLVFQRHHADLLIGHLTAALDVKL